MWLTALLIASTPLLAVNYKWALVDPHRLSAAPSWTAATLTAVWVTLLFAAALALVAAGLPRAAALTGSFAFGTAISPSIAPPYTLSGEEEPRFVRRFLRSRLHGVRVVSIKALLVLPVSFAASFVVDEHRSFYASALIALFFSLVKALYIADLLGEAGTAGRARSFWRTFVEGTFGLVVWFAAIFPVIDHFPEPEVDDYALAVAFAFGLLLRPF